MKKTLLATLLAIAAVSGAVAQDGTLPIAGKRGGPLSTRPNMKDSPKYQKALEIYNKLVDARGDARYAVPPFILNDDTSAVAEIIYGVAVNIRLEERAYDVCAAMGDAADDAIAFLLAHELTHYYERHGWRGGFAKEYKKKKLQIGVQLDTLVDDITNETQADYLGGFLAYSAGYGLFDKGPELIKNLYKAYHKKDQLPGYPSLSDRQALAKYTAEKLQDLVDVFDMANLLTATGNYADALLYHRYILNEYQSREIYNNVGVIEFLAAMAKCTVEKYRYPVELDLTSSARGKDTNVSADSALLRQALLHFDAAISLDPGYAPAYLNKACAYAVLGDFKRARFYAEEEARLRAQEKDKNGNLKYPDTGKDVDILLGILEVKAQDTEKARTLFQTALDAGRHLATYNLKVLNDEEPRPSDAGGSKKPVLEAIDQVLVGDISESREVDQDKNIQLDKNLFFRRQSTAAVFINDFKQRWTIFQMTPDNYTGKTGLGISLGATFAAITDTQKGYGTPASILSTPRGQILVYTQEYNNKNIIFILGPDGKLKRWVNYLLPDN